MPAAMNIPPVTGFDADAALVRERAEMGEHFATIVIPLRHPETMESTMADKAKDIYIVGLRNQHAVENQAVELLERQVGRLENYPEMSDPMPRHIEEIREQARRIEDLLARYDTSHSTFKDTMMSLAGTLAAMGHSVAPDEVVKN